MCGITGWFGKNGRRADLEAMVQTLTHRGPDHRGTWQNKESAVALGHSRLSILDLSSAGHQPMVSANQRYVIVFNGEIYNHYDFRRKLQGISYIPNDIIISENKWNGHSDTETLLEAVSVWGIEKTLQKIVGMFAFALWDRKEQSLTIARDRLGEKPLYYGWQGSVLLFGSELKALQAFPDFEGRISRDALTLYLRYNYIPAPFSIYENIFKLPPGTYLTVSNRNRHTAPVSYWSAHSTVESGENNLFKGTEADAIESLDRLLRDSVAGQMIADVPLGAFLSGGIDSSTIVALMQAQSTRPVKTFTIGFSEKQYNEAEHAKEVARHLGTDHTEQYVTPQETMDVIPKLPHLYDEPFADSSQIPTFLISQLARKHVKVSLSGDGGDELFGGYNRYFWVPNIWRRLRWMPAPVRSLLSNLIIHVSPVSWDAVFKMMTGLLPDDWHYFSPGDKIHKLAEILDKKCPEDIYFALVSHWERPAELVLNSCEPRSLISDSQQSLKLSEFEKRMMYMDLISYLPDDILVKVDRAAMGVSLETRVPFLDHRVVELAWQLPLSYKIKQKQGKWILRQVLYRYVPKQLIERPKMGFGIPIGIWLRGALREWAEDLLNERRLKNEGIFDHQLIRQKWTEHQTGKRNWQYLLWIILMFQAWLAR